MKKYKGNLLYRFTILSVRCFFKLLYRHRVYGKEHFYEKGALITSNHTSFYDPLILAISWPEEVHFLARETLFNIPILGSFISTVNSHPVKGTAKDITTFRTICKLLNEEKKVILFPEGRRSDEDQLAPFKPGTAFLMLRTHKAIIPSFLVGPYDIWNRKRKFPKLWGKTYCIFGSPLLYEEFSNMEKKEAEAAIAERLHTKILALKTWFEEGAQGSPP